LWLCRTVLSSPFFISFVFTPFVLFLTVKLVVNAVVMLLDCGHLPTTGLLPILSSEFVDRPERTLSADRLLTVPSHEGYGTLQFRTRRKGGGRWDHDEACCLTPCHPSFVRCHHHSSLVFTTSDLNSVGHRGEITVRADWLAEWAFSHSHTIPHIISHAHTRLSRKCARICAPDPLPASLPACLPASQRAMTATPAPTPNNELL